MYGFLIVLLSSLFFCFQNVIVRVLFNQHTVLGLFQTGGFVTPTLHNSFLLLCMRMLWVVPLMASLLSRLYPPTWKDLRHLGDADQRPVLLRAVGGGVLMFLYLALLYIAIGLIPTGIALTLFFTYPVFTALLSWWFFGSRPTLFRWSIMGLIMLGSYLTLPQVSTSLDRPSLIGILTGIGSGLVFAFYSVNAQKSFESIHPVPFTWISFTTTLALSTICLFLWHGQETHLAWGALWIGGLLSAIATSFGHLFNNFGIRLIGATSAAMISASNPSLTVVLAWFTIQESLTGLQLLGVAIVTLSVTLLSRSK